MDYFRLGLAAVGGWIAYFAFGFLVLSLVPALINESRKYPNVYRQHDELMGVMPIALLATLVATFVVAIIFGMIHPRGAGAAEGARLGLLIGVFTVCAAVLHNYVNLNIGPKLALGQAVAGFIQWMIVGTVIGAIYKSGN